MPATRKSYQNTTIRMPKGVYERAKKVANRSAASSFNEFVVQAIEEQVRRRTDEEIDAAFAMMSQDSDYQRDAVAMAQEFEQSDWEADEAAPARTTQRSREVRAGDRKAARGMHAVNSKTRSR